jgi:hypothetical protein
LQKALHGSPAAQAVLSPKGPITAPANAAPSKRSDWRRGMDSSAKDFEKSSQWSVMVGAFLFAAEAASFGVDECEYGKLAASNTITSMGADSHDGLTQQPTQIPWHDPEEHVSPDPHRWPHAPQLLASELRSAQP